MRLFHAHNYHHWPPWEAREEVTALGITLRARRETHLTGGAVGVSGGSSMGGGADTRCGG